MNSATPVIHGIIYLLSPFSILLLSVARSIAVKTCVFYTAKSYNEQNRQLGHNSDILGLIFYFINNNL